VRKVAGRSARMRPLIGITADDHGEAGGRWRYRLFNEYCVGVERAGGLPVMLHRLGEAAAIGELLGRIDGLLLSGGGDIDPARYGQAPAPGAKMDLIAPDRERFDLEAIRRFRETGKPLLGICLGCQEITVAFGGSLRQDLSGDFASHMEAREGARIEIVPGTRLAAIVGRERLVANSYHHQAIDAVPRGFVVSARSPEGLVEAIEAPDAAMAIGVQWHPERLLDDPVEAKLFRALVEEAAR